MPHEHLPIDLQSVGDGDSFESIALSSSSGSDARNCAKVTDALIKNNIMK